VVQAQRVAERTAVEPLTTPEAAPLPKQIDPVPVVFALWIGGVILQLSWLVRSYMYSRRLRMTAARVSTPAAGVPAGYSSGAGVPVLAGILRPMVLLPADIADWTDAEERSAMVLHETAHFERRDHLVNVFQAIIGAVLFFHPAVRYAIGRLNFERELACDQRVLAAGVRPALYAEALLKVAERTLAAQHPGQPAFHTSGEILERRITMISNYRGATRKGSRFMRVVRSVAMIGVAVLLLPDRAVDSGATLSLPVLIAGVPSSFSAQPSLLPQQVAVAPITIGAASPAPPAQGPGPAGVSGTIIDQSGAVVPGVTVQLLNPADGSVATTHSDVNGAYALLVSNGQYTLEIRLPGFATHRRAIAVQGQSVIADALLLMAPMATSVEVMTSAPRNPVAPPAPPPRQFPVRVGGDIAAANLINQPKPVYPPSARDRGVQGAVHLLAVIATDGTVASVKLDPSHPVISSALAQAAMESVKQWRYRPAVLNGAPIEVTTTITVNFSMN
jgi:TonB family protein